MRPRGKRGRTVERMKCSRFFINAARVNFYTANTDYTFMHVRHCATCVGKRYGEKRQQDVFAFRSFHETIELIHFPVARSNSFGRLMRKRRNPRRVRTNRRNYRSAYWFLFNLRRIDYAFNQSHLAQLNFFNEAGSSGN